MATATVNGIRLYYEISGAGEVPLVLVHGSWDQHQDRREVAAACFGGLRRNGTSATATGRMATR